MLFRSALFSLVLNAHSHRAYQFDSGWRSRLKAFLLPEHREPAVARDFAVRPLVQRPSSTLILTLPIPCSHIDLPVSWPSDASLPTIKGLQEYLTRHTLQLGELSQFANGAQAAYPSEGDFNEEKWQSVWCK